MVVSSFLISFGLGALGGPVGFSMVMLGLAWILEAIFDVCVVAPLFGCPLDGSAIRRRAG